MALGNNEGRKDRSISGRVKRFSDSLLGRSSVEEKRPEYPEGSLALTLQAMKYDPEAPVEATAARIAVVADRLRKDVYERLKNKDPLASLLYSFLRSTSVRGIFVNVSKSLEQVFLSHINVALGDERPSRYQQRRLDERKYVEWEEARAAKRTDNPKEAEELQQDLIVMRAFHRAFVMFVAQPVKEEKEAQPKLPLVKVPERCFESELLRSHMLQKLRDGNHFLWDFGMYFPVDTGEGPRNLMRQILPFRTEVLHDTGLTLRAMAQQSERTDRLNFRKMSVAQVAAKNHLPGLEDRFAEVSGLGKLELDSECLVDGKKMAFRDGSLLRGFHSSSYYESMRAERGNVNKVLLEDDALLEEPDLRYIALRLRDAVLEASTLREVFELLLPGLNPEHFYRMKDGDEPCLADRLKRLDAATEILYKGTALGVFCRGFFGAIEKYTMPQLITELHKGKTIWSIIRGLAQQARPMESVVDTQREMYQSRHVLDTEEHWKRLDRLASTLLSLDEQSIKDLQEDAILLSALRRLWSALRTRVVIQFMERTGWDIRGSQYQVPVDGESDRLIKYEKLMGDDETEDSLTLLLRLEKRLELIHIRDLRR